MKELYMRLGLHDEVRFEPRALGKERYVAVEDVYLLTFLADERDAPPDGEAAYQDTARDGRHDRHEREPRFLFK